MIQYQRKKNGIWLTIKSTLQMMVIFSSVRFVKYQFSINGVKYKIHDEDMPALFLDAYKKEQVWEKLNAKF